MQATNEESQRRDLDDLRGILKRLLDDFASLTGLSLMIRDIDDTPHTEQTLPHNKLCMDLIKRIPLGKERCVACARRWCAQAGRDLSYQIYTCRNGLIEFVCPIVLEGGVLGYLIGGQIRIVTDSSGKKRPLKTASELGLDPNNLEALNRVVDKGEIVVLPTEWYAKNARELGIDQAEYLRALGEIPVMSREKIEASVRALHNIVNSMSDLIVRLRGQTKTWSGVSERVRIDTESRQVARQILDELARSVQYRKASLQLIHGDTRTLLGSRGFDEEAINRWFLRPVSLDPLIKRIVDTQEPVILSETSLDSEWKPQHGTDDIKSWIGFPVLYDQKVIGLFTLDHDIPGFYQMSIKEDLVTFANRVAPKIWDARLLDSAQRLIRDMEIVSQVLKTIGDKLDTQDLLRTIAAQIAEGLNCTHCTIFFPKQTKESASRFSPDDITNLPSFATKLKQHADPVSEFLWSAFSDSIRQRLTAYCENTIDDRSLRAALVKELNQMLRSNSIYDAQRFSSVVLSQETRDRLARRLQKEVPSLLNRLLLEDAYPQEIERRLLLVPQVAHGGGRRTMTRRFKPGEGLVGSIFQQGKSEVFDDALRDSRFAAARTPRQQPRSMLVAPIRVGDRTIGVISADQDAYGWFSESDKRLVDALAQQAGIAIQRSIGLKLLQDIGNRIISSQEVGKILREVVDGGIRLTNTTTGVIYLISEDGKSVDARYHPPDFDHPDPRLDQEDGLTRTVMKTGEVLCIRDIRNNPRVNRALSDFFQSIIVVPLKIKGKVIGVFFLDDERPHRFTETEISLLLTLASQAAVALQRPAELADSLRRIESHQQLERQLEKLHQVVQEQDQEKVFDRIGEGIMAILGKEVTSTINLYDQETSTFGNCQAYGPLKHELCVPPREKGGTGRYVVEKKVPLYLENVLNPPAGCPTIRTDSIELGVKSLAALPLMRKDRVVGVLFVNAQKHLVFTQEIQRILEVFAGQVAVAIENARLYDNAQTSAATMRAAELGFLAAGISHEFNTYLHIFHATAEIALELSDPKKVREELRQILKDVMSAAAVIKGFRNIRDQVQNTKTFDLDVVVQQVLTISTRRFTDKGITLSYKNRGVHNVHLSPADVQTILINLIKNAFESILTKGGQGRIAIRVYPLAMNNIAIDVLDSGRGISKEEQKMVFAPFYSTKPGGMGVGLFSVQRLVSNMKGRVRIVSPNRYGGATFKVVLPMSVK